MKLKASRFNPIFFFFVAVFLLAHCSQKPERELQRSFYYWKTVFRLTQQERESLQQLAVNHLYIKFFDVEWNAAKNAAEPVAEVIFKEPPPQPLKITPVVFITNETIQQTSEAQIKELAGNIVKLLTSLSNGHRLSLSGEIQIDCDWTSSTKAKYFALLQVIKQHASLRGKTLSATIRLHQLKYISSTGLPPADKGLLMCYNMGNLRRPEIKNSIIELNELKEYTANLKNYPLHLDIALPLFDWYVWFHEKEYKGLIRNQEFDLPGSKEKILFHSDTTINGFTFEKGDWLRYEGSDTRELLSSAQWISKQLAATKTNIILYHLDENNLTKYKLYELENLFNSFR